MTQYKDIVRFLKDTPGYLKKSAQCLSARLDADYDLCVDALTEVRKLNREGVLEQDNDNNNDNVITEFDKFLKLSNIDANDVSSVKFWQTMSGEPRFSVVTKHDVTDAKTYKEEIEEFASRYSTNIPHKPVKNAYNQPVLYEISLPDIHYGKIVEDSRLTISEVFMLAIQDLVNRASGLEIERFLLPIGNDGMNSEGMKQTTTKGTPQHDDVGWKESFRGYWELIVHAVDYLKQIAPVHVIVVAGNHDYERMFYAGDVISGWFRNDPSVTVDNSNDSRKYYEYGNNMLMFTHGDNEKPADIPLIMATEKPEVFARTKFREAHCGHFHKEQVNEYRGIKVRFLPSICPNDEWHKKMGYDSKRAAQAFVWCKTFGLTGYLQFNVND